MTVYLEEKSTGQGRQEEIGGYTSIVEVPPMAQAYSEEPLDVGDLVPKMRKPLHAGDMAPLFEARTLDGQDIHLVDYRGKFVLLTFWAPEYDPELDRLKELHKTHGDTGKFQIIGLGGADTLEEVKSYVTENKIEWPVIYFGEKWDEGIAAQYGPYILLIDPVGKIVATWLRAEKLTNTVRDAMQDTDQRREARRIAPEELPKLKQALLTGDSKARREAFKTLLTSDFMTALDDSWLPAMRTAAMDIDPSVRSEVARVVGTRWVWRAPDQDPNAIDLLLKLSSDGDRTVRYDAVYHGLSTVRSASEPVIRRLIEMAMADHDRDLYSRIVWGTKGAMQAPPELVVRILAEQLNGAETDIRHAASIYALYRDLLEKEPPDDWNLARVKEHYPDDGFALFFLAREPFRPQDDDALWSEFAKSLPQEVASERLPTPWRRNQDEPACTAKLCGKRQVDIVKSLLENHPRLQYEEVYPLRVSDQLYFEELAVLLQSRTRGTPRR
jgi:peroxiredoxin